MGRVHFQSNIHLNGLYVPGLDPCMIYPVLRFVLLRIYGYALNDVLSSVIIGVRVGGREGGWGPQPHGIMKNLFFGQNFGKIVKYTRVIKVFSAKIAQLLE